MPRATTSKKSQQKTSDSSSSGKLRIGNDWNAISIIALSQSNPLKAVAEFVENSIDAHAQHITIIRGREKGKSYLRIIDDGDGLPTDADGIPDFKYVATHICDSIKRQMKSKGEKGLQGEFGIGLLSFWTVGEQLSLVSIGRDEKSYEMHMSKGDPKYTVTRRRRLVADHGTQLTVSPLLSGIRHFTGEKLQWYLASELRDRIRSSEVEIRILDRQARAEYLVQPQAFSGRHLNKLKSPSTPHGDVYVELYLDEPKPTNGVALYRSGTRVLENITELDEFQHAPWTSGYLQGIIDAPFLNVTPGTRLGVIQDDAFAVFREAIAPLAAALDEIIAEQKQAEEEEVNRDTLKSIQRAFREALLALPEEEYDWFEVYGVNGRAAKRPGRPGSPLGSATPAADDNEDDAPQQKAFFEHAGPLHGVRISPTTSVVSVRQERNLRAVARDRNRRVVEDDLSFDWNIVAGGGTLDHYDRECVTFTASGEPELVQLRVTVTQGKTECSAEAVVTVTDSLLPDRPKSSDQRGLPDYTFENAPGQLWRSRYDTDQNLIVINSGHRDFVYSTRQKTLKLRYACRLFSKELVLHNFPGYSPEQLLERMIELSLYTEENLR
ncbi:MAG: ATP-binding protein [Pirellulaceae bacterium]|jgi:hypothetical protein|nr:ATP-binding protein [Pirellulaceae bacterium]MDP7302094.1 ATP-binding protein [Pirellulaceae bacterium]HJN07952.1 ATP-binding protein [Pirellulaceae bacterium]